MSKLFLTLLIIQSVRIELVFGLLTSVARWRMKSTYGSILVHSFLNIFGR
jgi:hypothetical protein